MAGGKQDQYAATFGGVNFMEFLEDDKVIVNPLRIGDDILQEWAMNTVLFYTEQQRCSGKIIEEQAENVKNNKNDSLEAMHNVKHFELPPKEFDLLLYCAKHQGKILTKQQIYEEVWGEEYFYDDSNIMAIISRLRKKLEVNPSSPKYIQTVKGIGYRFNKEV